MRRYCVGVDWFRFIFVRDENETSPNYYENFPWLQNN